MTSQKNNQKSVSGRFFLNADARQIALTFILVGLLILIAAFLGHQLTTISILIVSCMALSAIGIGLWRLIPASKVEENHENIELVSQVIAGSPEGRLITASDGSFIYGNEAYRHVMKIADDEPGHTLLELLANDVPAREQLKALQNSALRGGSEGLRLELKIKDGRWLSVLAHLMEALPDCLVWYVAETTTQHKIEEVERTEREKLSEYFNNAPVGFYSTDARGQLMFVNRIFAEWLGYHQREIGESGVYIADLIAPGDDRQMNLLDQSADGMGRFDGEVQLKCRDGSFLPVQITQTLAFDESGNVKGSRSVVRELRQEREWRERVESAEHRFGRFFEAAPIGIVLLDEEGKVIEGNPAFRVLTETVIDSAIGKHVSELAHKADRAPLNEMLNEAMSSDSISSSLEVKLKGVENRAANLFASRIAGSEDGKFNLLLHLIDISAKRNLEIQFAQSQKMQAVGQLAGGIAHDFNNLLTAMIGFCDLLLLRHQVGDASYSDINQIKQNANRAAGLVRQLLAFSRQQTLRPQVADVTDILAELSNLLRRLIGEAIDLNIHHMRDLWFVKVDPSQFEQVIINLAVNARDAMNRDGKLSFRTQNLTVADRGKDAPQLVPVGDWVLVQIEDTGTGIPGDVIEKIFEPFFTTKKVGEGTGLGLSTVYGIIKQTGGFIFADNNEDIGTTFSIYLPRYEAEDEKELGDAGLAAVVSHKDLSGKGTILLVEDEDPVRLFASRALANKGYEVLEADCGEAALEIVEEHDGQIDLLVSDVVMPGMDGPTMVKHILTDLPDLKVIFISGYAEDAFRKDIDIDISKIDFLPKPFSLKEIAGKVKEVLTRDEAE